MADEVAEESAEVNSELPAEEVIKTGPVAVLSQVEKTYQLDSVSVPVIGANTSTGGASTSGSSGTSKSSGTSTHSNPPVRRR